MKISSNRKRIVLIILLVIVFGPIFGPVVFWRIYCVIMPDKINITRVYSNEGERIALFVAESLNYSKLLGISSLFGFSEEKSEYESYVYSPIYKQLYIEFLLGKN